MFYFTATLVDRDHIDRVRKLALTLAASEKKRDSATPLDIEVVEIAALLHDISDWKYSGSETAGAARASEWLKQRKS